MVFGGFASVSLASRIDDAEPTVVVSADAGSRGGKVVAYGSQRTVVEGLLSVRGGPAGGDGGGSSSIASRILC